jgi:hypothetical protein
LEALNVSSF